MESLDLHELGHALGLKHETEKPSVMAPILDFGLTRRTLYPSDASYIKCEY